MSRVSFPFALVLVLCAFAIAFNAYASEEKQSPQAIEAGEKAESVHYRFVNFARELGNPELMEFGARVDEALKRASVHDLCSLALELRMAENMAGKSAEKLTATGLLEKAADLAEVQKKKESLETVAATCAMLGESSKSENYAQMAANLEERRSSQTFDLCVENYDNDVYDIYVNGRHIGNVPAYMRSCWTNAGYIGVNRLMANGYYYKLWNTLTAASYGSYVWTLDAQ